MLPMTKEDRRALIHSVRVATHSARHCLGRPGRKSVEEAKGQLDEALARLEELLAAEAAEGN